MKKITLKDLKENLSRYAEEAAGGIPIHVTKYNKPFISITTAEVNQVHIGLRVGVSSIRSVAKLKKGGAMMKVLNDDRDSDNG